ncbi:MAG: HYR domain-containing protein [Bacteroidota bacterium]
MTTNLHPLWANSMPSNPIARVSGILLLALIFSFASMGSLSAQCTFSGGNFPVTSGDTDNEADPVSFSQNNNIFPAAVGNLVMVQGNTTVEICFWGDMGGNNETFDVVIGGQTFSSGDFGTNPSQASPACRTFVATNAAAISTDLDDGNIGITYNNFGNGWDVMDNDGGNNGGDQFNAQVNSISFDYNIPTSLSSSASSSCSDGANITFTATPNIGVGTRSFQIFPSTPGFNSSSGTITVADANPGMYNVVFTYSVNGCDFQSSEMVEVFPAPRANLKPTTVSCNPIGGTVDLGVMFDGFNDAGGTFSVLSGGGSVNGSTFTPPAGGGCFEIQYAVDNPNNCTNAPYSDIANLLVTIEPDPVITISGANSPVCSDGADVSVTVGRTSTGGSPVYTVSTPGNMPMAISAGPATLMAPASAGSITYEFCLSETNTVATCAGTPATTACVDTSCVTYTVFNDGIGCGANAAFDSECPPDLDATDVCEVEVMNNLALSCSFFTINGPQLIEAELENVPGVVTCAETEVCFDWQGSLPGNFGDIATGGPAIRDLNGVTSAVCFIIEFEICIPLPIVDDICIDPIPLGEFEENCGKTVGQFVFDALGALLGGDGGSGIVVADTDGDGSFDQIIEEYGFPASGDNACVPNNIQGESGTITLRNVVSWPFNAQGYCGTVSDESINLLDLLPIAAIPIVGVIIEDIIAAASCNVELVFTDEETIEIPVINTSPPEFANCNDAGYVFSEDGICDTEVNWSIPVAYDGCGGGILPYRGRTAGTDASFFNGTPPAEVVAGPSVAPGVPDPGLGSGVYQTAGPIPGSDLEPGTYMVTYTAYSCNAVEASCTFPVVVTPGDPVLVCPGPFTVKNDPSTCDAVVVGLLPSQGISCSSVINYSIDYADGTSTNTSTPYSLANRGTHNDPSGLVFPVGTSMVTYTMMVDINGDGDVDDTVDGVMETQTCDFEVTVLDTERPVAECIDLEVKLDNTGNVLVFAEDQLDASPFLDGGSSDNCVGDLSIQVAKPGEDFGDSANFDCTETGYNLVTLQVMDPSGNVSTCLSQIYVEDFFEGITFDLDIPELCLEANNPEQLDFSNYLVITLPDGTVLSHDEVENNAFLGDAVGAFGITYFAPAFGTTSIDPGSITTDGMYTPSPDGTGYVTVSYLMALPNAQVQNNNVALTGCLEIAHSTFELRQPLEMESPECECIVQNDRIVDLDTISGGLEPYTIQFSGVQLDIDSDGIADDVDGEFTYEGSFTGSTGIETVYDIGNFNEDLGNLLVDYTQPTWSFTVVDARGCELFRSGSCDNDDENGTPEILCEDLGPVNLFTEELVCEAQYSWDHPLPTDNCDVILYTYTIENPDGSIAGPFDITALLNPDITMPLPDQFSAEYDFEHDSPTENVSTVTYYAEDAVGNFTQCSFTVTVTDDDPPRFINCPEPAVVVDAPELWCAAFANYSLPLAEDNCDIPVVTQIDTTGLTSGDLYPVGITINTFEAVDATGNSDTCNVKIIVNDYHTPPTMECPDNVVDRVNDPGDCGAVVNDIAPSNIDDNCIDNLTIVYRISNEEGDEVASGFDDASGNFFELGTNTVEYAIQDMPMLLITEVTHDLSDPVDGTLPVPGFTAGNPPTGDYLEITNFNRANLDVSCLMIERIHAGGSETYAVPTFTILEPGGTLSIHFGDGTDSYGNDFFNVPGAADLAASEPAAYIVSLSRSILDVVVLNDFDISGLAPPMYNLGGLDITDYWSGSVGPVNGAGVVRTTVWDTDTAADFAPGEACLPTTIGMLNPGLAQPTPNGASTAIQAQPTVRVECNFTVEIIDDEDPVCGLYSDFNDYVGGPITINYGECIETVIPVGDTYDVADVNLNLAGLAGDFGNLEITLISPEGTEIELADAVCAGTDAIEFTFDGDFGMPIDQACGFLNIGGMLVMPIGDIEAFNGEAVNGDWILQIGHNGQESTATATIDSYILFISGRDPYPDYTTTLENDPGVCGANYTWFHPILFDNCPGGSIVQEIFFEGEVEFSQDHPIYPENTEVTYFFNVGVSTVRYTLTDAVGNTSVCSFIVTVNDTENPTLTCPPDITIQLDGGECDVIYVPHFPTDYTYDDNCGVVEVFADPDWSIPLPIGVNPVNLTVRDSSGNDTTCTYIVTVLEYIPMPPQMTCISELNVHLDGDCEQTIIPEMVLAGNEYYCFDTYEITLLQPNEAGGFDTLPDNVVGIDQIGEIITYEVYDPRNDIMCWGTIDVGFFEAPEFTCPPDTSIDCNGSADVSLLGEPILLSCALAGATVTHEDSLFRNDLCDDPRAFLFRTWTVTDNYGNSGSCVQTITIDAFDLDDIIFPPNMDGFDSPAISCVAAANDPNLTEPINTGFPTVADGSNIFQTNFCSASFLYTDEVYDICAGSFEILRTWKVRNTCLPVIPGVNPAEHIQVIRVLDQENPVISCPEDETISTGPFDCEGVYLIPPPDVEEGCSDFTYTVVVSGGTLTQLEDGTYALSELEVGTVSIRYEVEDECGRFGECTYQLTITDQVSATAICENGLNISLDGNGYASVGAEDIDGGSDDLCGSVTLEIRRAYHFDPVSCAPLDNSYFSEWGETVDVNCCDLDSLVTMELRVTDEENNSSVCWTNVLIEDKIAPLCLPPNPVQISCLDLESELPDNLTDAFANNPEATGALLDVLFGSATAIDNCGGATITQSVIDTRNSCGAGLILRSFVATDEQGFVSDAPCTQDITVLPVHDYTITFPADESSDECIEPDYDGLIIDNLGCGLFTTNVAIDTFEATADECYKLRVTYEIINWCEYASEEDPYIIPRDADNDDFLEEATWLHVLPRSLNTINDDIAWLDTDANRSNGFLATLDLHETPAGLVFGATTEPYGTDEARGAFLYRQYIKVYDDVPPVLTVTNPAPFEDTDGDCVEPVEIGFTVSDDCVTPDDYSATAELDAFFADQDGDDLLTLADFVPTFEPSLQPNVINNLDGTFTINFDSQLPLGRHAIRVRAEDGCGNTTIGLIIFEIIDVKAPTPVCINGLTATLMPDGNGGGMAAVWASEYVASTVEDCNEPVEFAIYRSSTAAAADFAGPMVGDTGLVLTCDDLGLLPVRIYAIDGVGNADYCETTLLVQAFQESVCDGGGGGNIFGSIATPGDEPLAGVELSITDGNDQENTSISNAEGIYTFAGLNLGEDYTIDPNLEADVNVASAVTTYDILLISRHILDVAQLENPYQHVLADVNLDGDINVLDLVHIRLVIMGQQTSYPNGPSWRFVDANYDFSSDPADWLNEPFTEIYNVNNLNGDVLDANFIALEMGNVSEGILAGNASEDDARSTAALTTTNVDLLAGNTYEVAFTAKELYGFQGTLELAAGLELVDIYYGQLTAQNVNLDRIAEGLIAISYDDATASLADFDSSSDLAPLFSLEVRATRNAELSEVLTMTDRITVAEAYPLTGGVANLGLAFNSQDDLQSASELFSLEQNRPNPFRTTTQIAFNLPEAGTATLLIQDAIGRTILVREIDGAAGYNQLNLPASDLNGAKGVLMYTLTMGDHTATRRMIID